MVKAIAIAIAIATLATGNAAQVKTMSTRTTNKVEAKASN